MKQKIKELIKKYESEIDDLLKQDQSDKTIAKIECKKEVIKDMIFLIKLSSYQNGN